MGTGWHRSYFPNIYPNMNRLRQMRPWRKFNCAICGKEFETRNWNARYCDACKPIARASYYKNSERCKAWHKARYQRKKLEAKTQ